MIKQIRRIILFKNPPFDTMQQLIQNINNKVKSICKPNPEQYPDPSVQKLVWNRNLMNIYTNVSFLLSYPVFSAICKFSLPINMALMGLSFTLLSSFLILCRSYLQIFNLGYVIITFFLGILALEMIRETVYFYTCAFILLLVTMIIRTGDTKLALLSGAGQIFTFLTKLKEKFIVLIKDEEPEVFADKFVKSNLFFFFFVLLVSITLVKTLEKRTVELTKASHALEKALDQQKTFIFSFSHELRNPINSLLGNLQLVLQGEVLSERAAEMINVAKVCGEILLHNINNVLDTGKHDIGKLEVNPVETRLHDLFQRTWSIYSELLRQKKLKGQLKIEKDLPAMVKIDSHKVNQMMLNLIGNAIKFTEKGSVTVTVKWLNTRGLNEECFEPIPYDETGEGLFEKEENLSTMNTSRFSTADIKFLSTNDEVRESYEAPKRQEETQGILKIIVKDTGSGMKKEDLEKLFQKFSQVSETVSQRQIGTGLGLFITKEICIAMNGEIRAYSRLGAGSTFVVCIPTTSVPLTNVQRANSESILDFLKHKHIKALVADDSPFNVNLICDYFSQFGGETVGVAYNGFDIFMKYEECIASGVDIDVVTLDIDMPIMDGRKVCENIRRYEKEKRLKPVLIILISGNYDREQVEEYVNNEKGHRADCFLRKPVSFSEFTRTVYNLVSH